MNGFSLNEETGWKEGEINKETSSGGSVDFGCA